MSKSFPIQLRIGVELLESREVPSAGDWFVEPFQRGNVNGMPSGWQQWSNQVGQQAFTVDQAGPGLGDQGRLLSNGLSSTEARAWVTTSFAANVEASVAVYLNSLSPAEILVRGQNLDSATPSYYAASVVRGAEVQLVRVVNGKTQVLGTLKSSGWVSDQWVTLKIRAEANQISVFLYRGDTNQYLDSNGKWVRQTAAALVVNDSSIQSRGYVGVARAAAVAGVVPIDSLRIGPPGDSSNTPIRDEQFNEGASNSAPPGWSQWSSGSSVQVATSADDSLRITANSTSQARVWMTQPVPTNSQVTAAVFIDSLATAGIFARGSSVNSSKPTYYSLTVSRGLTIELSRVVNGVTTVIGSLSTLGWQSGLWLQMSLVVKGSQLGVEIYRSDTGQYLNADGTWGLSPAWAMLRTDSTITSGGLAGLSRGVGAAGQLAFDNFLVTAAPTNMTTPGNIPTQQDKPTTVPLPPPGVPNPPPVPPTVPPTVPPPPVSPPTVPPSPSLPDVTQNMSWIRIAELAYGNTALSAYALNLLKSSIDLVIPNTTYLNAIAAANPNTAQMLYTNLSNIYGSLLTDWNNYADAHGISRETAFYHVSTATAFQGLSPSSVPVNQFWAIYRGSDSTSWKYISTNPAPSDPPFAMASQGQAVVIAYPEKFREIDIKVSSPPSGGWGGIWQYVSSVDANGNPTSWSDISLTSDTTSGFRRSGQFTFDPPSNWVTASINGSAKMYYLRFVTTSAGTAPMLNSIQGANYTNYNNTTLTGTIPVFDYSADKNHDGYLDDTEWANRKSGDNARFAYQSRLTFPYYGPMRFATNPSSGSFQAWAIDYTRRLLAANPKADGVFVDNSTGLLDVDPNTLIESITNYAQNYGSLVGAVNNALGSKWVLANTAGGAVATEPMISQGVSNLEEFALRPQYANAEQFMDLAATVANRMQLGGGKGYQILDSLPTNGIDPTSSRFLMSTLAMYYLVGDPKLTMLMINGGNEPSSDWSRHWTDAIKYNVGKPLGTYSVFATGKDPANNNYQYTIFQRKYQNALMLYKPVSSSLGQNGSIADNTATTSKLDGWYRVLQSNGTLGPLTNTVTLRNGEGVVLVKA